MDEYTNKIAINQMLPVGKEFSEFPWSSWDRSDDQIYFAVCPQSARRVSVWLMRGSAAQCRIETGFETAWWCLFSFFVAHFPDDNHQYSTNENTIQVLASILVNSYHTAKMKWVRYLGHEMFLGICGFDGWSIPPRPHRAVVSVPPERIEVHNVFQRQIKRLLLGQRQSLHELLPTVEILFL